MSQKKILFFVIVGIIILGLTVTITYISNQHITKPVPTSLKIWINDGTTESYGPLIDGFKKYAPEYAKTDITIEKQSSDSDRYRTLLLSTLTDGSGPDIFMLHSGEDTILETKIAPIPSDMLNFSDFDKRYDDIFRDLLSSTGSGKDKQILLKGVPLGYETLGVFYNKSLIRQVPKTWNDLENLYNESPNSKYPSNLGLGPTYTPNMIDILPIWLAEGGVGSYKDISSGDNILDYLSYGKLGVNAPSGSAVDISNPNKDTLSGQKISMYTEKFTTLDLFMQGDIGMIIGYPSLILELEKSSKRAGSKNSKNIILTERLPQVSTQKNENIGRYGYFGISKLTTNPKSSLKFMEYLMTPEAQRLFIGEYPYLIPAQLEFYSSVETNSLSENFDRTTLASFIPTTGENITIFQYGLKSRFEQYLKEGIDTNESPDIESIIKKISGEISCEINSSLGLSQSGHCSEE